MSAFLKAALSYAAKGWPVLPLFRASKAPLASLVRHGVGQATTDPDVLREWWGRVPGANVGIACRDLLVVDPDPRNGSEHSLAELHERHGAFPKTPTARTGSGGLHILFNRPSVALTGKLCPGVDLVHGPRRYIVAAPSLHPCGKHYEWITPPTVPLADAPDWVLELGARKVEAPETNSTKSDVSEDERTMRARRYLEQRDPAIQGQGGDDHTFRTCGLVARGFGLTAEQAFAVLQRWNQTCRPPWSRDGLRRKIAQALEHSNVVTGSLLEKKRSA